MKTSSLHSEGNESRNFQNRGLNELGLIVADHVGAMLAYWDKNQICRFANIAYREWFGKEREELIDKITMKELLGSLYEKNLPYILGALEGKPQIFEREIKLPDGKVRYSLANYYPDIANGQVKGFFVHVADITAIKKLEMEVKESELRFKKFLENAPDAIVIVDKRGIIQIVNNQCVNLLGYTEDELQGKAIEILMPDQFRQKHISERMNFVSHPQVRSMGIGLDLLALHKNGKEIPVEISLGPIETKEGIMVSASIRDITWKVQKDGQLIQSMEIINRQNKQLQNFTYLVSHNLKSYSNNLSSVLNLFINAKSDEEKNEMLNFLKNISSGFSTTIEHLNEIVDVQNKGELKQRKINLHHFIDRCLESLSIEIKTIGLIIRNFVDEKIEFLYNEAFLESILHNLISNAIKYRQPGRVPVLELNTCFKENYIMLQIKDNGRGINLEKYGKSLFGIYKTFHGNPDAKGIGLFLTKYQVEALGGYIEVQSTEGVGTSFNIYFFNK